MRQASVTLLLLLLIVNSFARAQEEEGERYKTMGAPPAPKVPVQWNRYHDYAEISVLLEALAEAHPNLCRLESLGKSYGDREMWLVTITGSDRGKEQEKPAFYIDGGIHANELQGPEVVLYTAWYLLERYGRAPFVTQLLDERVFYLVPMMSPDSRDAHMHDPHSTHSPRSGQRPVDDDKDGLIDEDGPDDLDGDGSITQMRIRDSNGRWKSDPEYPNLLVPAEPDEKGEYTLLQEEGYDNDGDGLVNEDWVGYYDPNRDWAWQWQPNYIQEGAHHYPFSIEENRLVADFVMAHPNIAGAQSYHNSGGMILRGPGVKEDRYETEDVAVYQAIARKGEFILPGYRYLNVAHDLYEVYGGELDWFHQMQGSFCFTNELFTAFNFFRRSSEEGPFGRREDIHVFNRYLLFEEGIVPWREHDHPQYGKVEIGGLKKQWMRQPPSFLLEEECHRNMAFTLYHADQLPMVKVQHIDVKELPGGLTQLTAVVVNERLTPTHSAIDVKNKLTPPDLVLLEGEGLQVSCGMFSENRFFTAAMEQKRRPGELRIENLKGMGVLYVRWLVRGTAPFRVTIRSVKGGVHSLAR